MPKLNRINDIVTTAIVARDSYLNSYRRAKETRKKGLDYIRKNYIKGSEQERIETKRINSEYVKSIADAKEKSRQAVKDAVEDNRSLLNASVSNWSPAVESRLHALEQIGKYPLSQAEFEAVKQRYMRQDDMPSPIDYWTLKVLRGIAEKNGISAEGLGTDLDVKLQTLQDIEDRFDTFLDGYPEHEIVALSAVSDSNLYRLEKTYTDADIAKRLNAEQVANRTMANVRSQSGSVEQARVLANGWLNASTKVKQAMLSDLADRPLPEQVIGYTDVMLMSEGNGIGKQINDWITSGQHEDYTNASAKVRQLSDIMNNGSEADTTRFVRDNASNRFFLEGIKESGIINRPMIKNALGTCEEYFKKADNDTKGKDVFLQWSADNKADTKE